MKPTSICFFVAGDPVGTPRVKAARRGKFLKVYTPKTADDWKMRVGAAWENAKPPGFRPITGPVRMSLAFLMPRPKSHFTAAGLIKRTAPRWCNTKPDFDNLEKAVADQLTNSGLWKDDSLVCLTDFAKRYINLDESPGCHININLLTDL